jgi:DNA-binding MarR family transcriptional regulator
MDEGDLERLTREVRALTSIIARLAHASFEQQLNQSDLGVSPLQFGVMRSLAHHQHTISELSRKFVVDPSTLVPVVDSLERKGLVERNRDPQDRRRVPLRLTEEGQQLLCRDLPVSHDDPFYRALSNMGEESSIQLRTLLEEVLRAMPEGGTIMEEVQSRLDALNSVEKAIRQDTAARYAQGHGHEQRHLEGRAGFSDKGRD